MQPDLEVVTVLPGMLPRCSCRQTMVCTLDTLVLLCLLCDWWPDAAAVAQALRCP